jgi:hypothetical protein
MTKEAKRQNAKHVRPVEVEYDADDGIPAVDEISSGVLLLERRNARGMSHGDLLEALERQGVYLQSNAVSNWYKSVVPAEHFGAVAKAINPEDRHAERRMHLMLLRTAIPEGSLALFDELVADQGKLSKMRLREALNQRARRGAARA